MDNAIARTLSTLLALCALSACGDRNVDPDDGRNAGPTQRVGQEAYVPDQLIVRSRDDINGRMMVELLRLQGADLLNEFDTPNLYLVGLPEGSSVYEWEQRLEALPEIIDAQPNFSRRP